MTYKDDARSSRSGKASRMIGSETDSAPRIAAAEGSQVSSADGPPKNLKAGGKINGNKAVKRLDKPARRAAGGRVTKGNGKTTVNVIVSPQGRQGSGAPQAMVLPPAPSPVASPMPPGGGAPPSPMPPGGAPSLPPRPMGAGSPVPPMPMRQRGGRVKMDAGAGSGKGRLEKMAL